MDYARSFNMALAHAASPVAVSKVNLSTLRAPATGRHSKERAWSFGRALLFWPNIEILCFVSAFTPSLPIASQHQN
jgi:hypothetical protein